jgi:putative transposase
MRQHKLLQRSRNADRRRPGFFRVIRPDEFWHIDTTKVWTAAHGWVCLHVAVDCCTREVTCWRVDLSTRSEGAIACVGQGILDCAVRPGCLSAAANGNQFTSRDVRRRPSARGVTHPRGGYRDPESQS